MSFTEFTVIHTPGIQKAEYALISAIFLLRGYSFAGTIGRTDFPGSSYEEMMNSLEKIKNWIEIIIYPGHGSSTTLANELRHNPFLNGNYD